MMIIRRIFPIFFLILASSVQAGSSSDLEREKLIADRLSKRVTLGQAIWFKSGKVDVFSLYTEQNKLAEAKGAIILLHSMGAHPDWPEVITHIRTALPQQGWSTFSIQLPILAPEDPIETYGETYMEAGQRIRSAVIWLKEKEYKNIVVVGYSFGAATAVQSLAAENSGVMGLVGISMLAQPFLNPRLLLLEDLAQLKLPLLDIYGSLDRSSIIEQAADRRLSARKAENNYFKQLELEGADHSFSGVEEVLIKRIRGWLDKLIVEMQVIQDNNDS